MVSSFHISIALVQLEAKQTSSALETAASRLAEQDLPWLKQEIQSLADKGETPSAVNKIKQGTY